jgi:hypothetical protein
MRQVGIIPLGRILIIETNAEQIRTNTFFVLQLKNVRQNVVCDKCLRQSFKVDLLIRCITVSCENILMVARIPVACSGKVNACQYVHHTRRTCEHA